MAEESQKPRAFRGLVNSALNQGNSIEKCNQTEAEKLAQRLEAKQQSRRRQQIHIPKLFEKAAEWENLKWISDKNPTAFKAIYDFCEDPRQGKAPLLFGKSGCGKSHLLWAAAYRLTEWAAYLLPTRWAKAECERFDKAKREGTEFFQATQMPVINVIVTSGADVAHQLRDSVKDDNTSYVVDKLSHRRVQIIDLFYHSPETFDLIPILILDDIEVMKMSDWLAEELYRIIDHRYSEMMPTLMATNLSAEELRGHLGDRITRRLLDMSNPIVMK